MNPDILRSKIIERLKQGGYYTPRDVGGQMDGELREKEELRIIKTMEDLEMTAHEVVRS